MFQSPRGDFGFLKAISVEPEPVKGSSQCVSIPSRGFWFFEAPYTDTWAAITDLLVSIPSRGFWFFEVTMRSACALAVLTGFNPLAGILVF